jgi:hypothetical protein
MRMVIKNIFIYSLISNQFYHKQHFQLKWTPEKAACLSQVTLSYQS